MTCGRAPSEQCSSDSILFHSCCSCCSASEPFWAEFLFWMAGIAQGTRPVTMCNMRLHYYLQHRTFNIWGYYILRVAGKQGDQWGTVRTTKAHRAPSPFVLWLVWGVQVMPPEPFLVTMPYIISVNNDEWWIGCFLTAHPHPPSLRIVPTPTLSKKGVRGAQESQEMYWRLIRTCTCVSSVHHRTHRLIWMRWE